LNEWIPDIKESIMDAVLEENFDDHVFPKKENQTSQSIAGLFSFHVVHAFFFVISNNNILVFIKISLLFDKKIVLI
jgi:hypothetical protein